MQINWNRRNQAAGGSRGGRTRVAPSTRPATGPGQDGAEDLVALLEARADVMRVQADLVELARSPRHRSRPGSMVAARALVSRQLQDAGWTVQERPFERGSVSGFDDEGEHEPTPAPVRHRYAHLAGVNLIAELPATSDMAAPRVLLVAHLDTVAVSPGADDNASGVVALLECARLLASLDRPVGVRLAVVDLEEVGLLGSTVLAEDQAFVADVSTVVCLESVGTFDDSPGSQQLGALGLAFPALARRIRADQNRGDFVLLLGRRSSAATVQALAATASRLRTRLPVHTLRDPRSDGWLGRFTTRLFPPLANLDRSDHAPFWHRGVPAMMVTTTASFRNPHYHGPGDRPERVDVARVTALAVALAAMLGAGDIPTG